MSNKTSTICNVQYFFLEQRCVGALQLCRLSTLECKVASSIERPWPNDLQLAKSEGSCCFLLFQFKWKRGEMVKLEPGFGVKGIDFGVMSVKKIECEN